MPILPYHTPEIINSVSEIPDTLRKEKLSGALIITDPSIRKLGILSSLESALTEKGIPYKVYDQTVPNPTVKNVEEAKELYPEDENYALIGFGGGSSIDCAKAVGARIARKNKPISKMKGILKVMRPIPYLIAIPTTAGTGSETTVTTVITDGKNGHKFPINDFYLIPKVAVLDPELTRTLPPSLTATTGMDAFTHAVEAFIGRSTIPATEKDSLKAVELIAEYLPKAYSDGNDMQARGWMLYAAFLAGRAFTQSYVGYCHAVAHSLGGKYNTPHGLANAVLLPYVLEAYGETIYKKSKKIAIAMGIADESVSPKVATKRLIKWIREINRSMGIPEKIKGIRQEDISTLSTYAAKEANPLYPVPVLMTAKELEKFYYMVMEEKA